MFEWFEDWCNDEFGHGEAFAAIIRSDPALLSGRNKLWIRFFLLAVYATMYVRDHLRAEFYHDLGFDPTGFDMEVFRKTNEISKQVFPLTLPIDKPKFRTLLDRMVANTVKLERARERGGFFGRLRAGVYMAGNAGCFARLYLMRPEPNELPADFRLAPGY